jgi:hypothetical protein
MRRGSIVRSPPVVVAGVNMPPAPRSLPPAVKVDVGPIVAAPPRPIQQTVLQRAQGVLSNPLVRNALGAAAAAAFSAITAPGAAPRVGRVTLPGQSPVISPGSLPLTALNPGALQYRALNPALAQAQEQDCSCRPARKKRKGKPCKNPVKSRRSFERDGKRFITTTKEVKCQASSRKKRRLRPVQ